MRRRQSMRVRVSEDSGSAFAGARLVVGEGCDGVFAGGEPGGIGGAQQAAAHGDERSAGDPSGRNQNGKRGEGRQESGAGDKAHADAGEDADAADQRGLPEQRLNDIALQRRHKLLRGWAAGLRYEVVAGPALFVKEFS